MGVHRQGALAHADLGRFSTTPRFLVSLDPRRSHRFEQRVADDLARIHRHPGVLRDDRHLAVELAARIRIVAAPDVDTSEGDVARVRLFVAHEDPTAGRLAAPGRTNDVQRFTGKHPHAGFRHGDGSFQGGHRQADIMGPVTPDQKAQPLGSSMSDGVSLRGAGGRPSPSCAGHRNQRSDVSRTGCGIRANGIPHGDHDIASAVVPRVFVPVSEVP